MGWDGRKRHGIRYSRQSYTWASSLGGRRGVVRITPEGAPQLFLSGPAIVGMAFAPSKALILATANSLFRVQTGITGRPLL